MAAARFVLHHQKAAIGGDVVVRDADPGAVRVLPIEEYTRPAADRAVALDDDLAEAHFAQGMLHSVFDGDVKAAERDFGRAIELDPRFGQAHALRAIARVLRGDEAALDADAAIAIRLDPVSPLVAHGVALACPTRRSTSIPRSRGTGRTARCSDASTLSTFSRKKMAVGASRCAAASRR